MLGGFVYLNYDGGILKQLGKDSKLKSLPTAESTFRGLIVALLPFGNGKSQPVWAARHSFRGVVQSKSTC